MKLLFKIIKFFVRVFYPKTKIVGLENLPDEPCIIVGNHAQMNGPIISELFFGDDFYTWCAGQMMNLKDVPQYAFKDFWSYKPKWCHWFYKLCSYLIAPLSVIVFNNARTVGVYHDNRAVSTFRKTIKLLEQGKSIIIFPEHDKKFNNIVYEFQNKFISVAKLYHKRTGKKLNFVPMYVAPKLKSVYIGNAIVYDINNDADAENERICKALMDAITDIAEDLPLHRVVPYRNMPKKLYPTNVEKSDQV